MIQHAQMSRKDRIAKIWKTSLWCSLLMLAGLIAKGQALVLDCPADTLVCIADNSCETVVGIPAPEAFTVCPSGDLEFFYEAGSLGAGVLPPGGLILPGPGPGIWLVEVSATDDCGNSESCSYILTVLDCQPPFAGCFPEISVELEPGGTLQIWASDFDQNSSDNCGGVSFAFSDDPSDLFRDLSCADLGTQPLDIWVFDLAGNASSCTSDLVLSPGAADCPTMVTLTGAIYQPNGMPAPGVRILLEGDQQGETTTDANGQYQFSVPSGGNYQVRPCAGGGLLNGVSVFDLALIEFHILGIQPQTSPYALIRADVNNDGSIDPLDLADLRKLILGNSAGFPNNLPWRFVPTGYLFPDPQDPFQSPFPEIWEVQPETDIAGIDFFILKTGDLAGQTILSTDGFCEQPLSQISGQVFFDENGDCQMQAGEERLSGRIVHISGSGGDWYTRTGENGRYFLTLPPGDYSIAAVSQQPVWTACSGQVVSLAPGDKNVRHLGLQEVESCPWLTVSVSAATLTPCETQRYELVYENSGTAMAFAAAIDFRIDSWQTLVAAGLPWTTPDGIHYFFELGDLAPGQSGSFSVDLHLSCDALPGQTHRVEARISPDNLSCLPPNPAWDGASLTLEGRCDQDTLRFELHNMGDPMSESLNFIVIEDDMIMRSEPFQLGSDQLLSIDQPATGATYRLLTEQTPGHPGNSRPTLAIEGCGGLNPGFVTVFQEDEDDDFISVSVLESQEGPLPFFKEGFPKGYREKHLIKAGEYLDYQIRFQNTGSDTVKVVAVIDSLSQQFDWATFQTGAASHSVEVKMIPGVGIVFIVENAVLPPAQISPEDSRGFVSFRIRTRDDLPDGTFIRQASEVFIDNQPTATLITSFHTIGSDFVEELPVGLYVVPPPETAWDLFPNPAGNRIQLRLAAPTERIYILQVRDLLGRLLREASFQGGSYIFQREDLPDGIYYFTLESEGQYRETQKVVFLGPGTP